MRRILLRLERESQWVGMYDARQKRVRVPSPNSEQSPVQYGEIIRLDIELGHSGTVVVLRGIAIEEVTSEPEEGQAFHDSADGVVGGTAATDTAPMETHAGAGGGGAGDPQVAEATNGPQVLLVIEISPIDRDKVNHVRAFLRGALLNLRRRRRVMVRLPVVFRGIDGLVETFSRDISEEGMFVYSQSLLPEKTKLQLQVRFPDGGEAILDAYVVYVVRPEREAQPGMGLRFELSNPAAQTILPAQVGRVEQALLAGELPDEYY